MSLNEFCGLLMFIGIIGLLAGGAGAIVGAVWVLDVVTKTGASVAGVGGLFFITGFTLAQFLTEE